MPKYPPPVGTMNRSMLLPYSNFIVKLNSCFDVNMQTDSLTWKIGPVPITYMI